MLNDCIESIIAHLKKDSDIDVRMYTGQFDSLETLEGAIRSPTEDSLNIIFIDFDGEVFNHLFQQKATIKLYFVGSTMGKNELHRIKVKKRLINLIEKVNNSFLKIDMLNNANTPKTTKIKKIQDGISSFGYLVVYEKEFEVEITKEGDALL